MPAFSWGGALALSLLSNNRALDWYKNSMTNKAIQFLRGVRSVEVEADSLVPDGIERYFGPPPVSGVEGLRIQSGSVLLYPHGQVLVCYGTPAELKELTLLF